MEGCWGALRPARAAGAHAGGGAVRCAAALSSALAPLPHNRWARETEGWTWYSWLSFYVPIFGWIRTYNWRAWLIVSGGGGGRPGCTANCQNGHGGGMPS